MYRISNLFKNPCLNKLSKFFNKLILWGKAMYLKMLQLVCDSRSLECVTNRCLAQRRTPICAQYMTFFMGVFQRKVCGLHSIERILIYIRAFSIHKSSLHIRSNFLIRRRCRKFEYSVNADNPNVRPTNRHIRHHSNRHDFFLIQQTLKMT